MNTKAEWGAKLKELQNSQIEASRREAQRQIRYMEEHGMTGGSSYPQWDEVPRDRFKLTFDGLVSELKGLKSRLDEVNNLGSRPRSLVERLTGNISHRLLGRSPKDPRETLGNEMQSFSWELQNDAKQEGLDFDKASIEAGFSQRRFTDLQRELEKLNERVSQLQNAGQDPDVRIEAVYACLREQQRLEQQFGKFDAEERQGATKFALFPKPLPAELLEAKEKFVLLRRQLNPVRESQERLLGFYNKKMAEVQALPKGFERDLGIDIVYNLALEEKLKPSRFYEHLEKPPKTQTPEVWNRGEKTLRPGLDADVVVEIAKNLDDQSVFNFAKSNRWI